MITEKQKWFLGKLVNQIKSKLGNDYMQWLINNTFYYSFDLYQAPYKTTKLMASKDIDTLIKFLNEK